MREADSRLIPHMEWEIKWARERPAPDRTPLPAVGDEVLFRAHYWGPVQPATVLWLQPLDDLDDPNLWTIELDASGNPIGVGGRPVFSQHLDPWPLLRIRLLGGVIGETREARLRGAPGWLPLDHERRYRPVPRLVEVR